ncbi:MAG: biotin--[acetyl-CoA-carboxylase] ligase [Wenzhouxiangellaceae bacterium]|nr:biotin--[acetyl-CoA-carboxylase] ligase [Wenzhouxiangellaceae bacterium]
MNAAALELFWQLGPEPVSGQALAERCGVTRAAVWKWIETLRAAGLDVESVAGAGYRVETAAEPLSARRIRDRMNDGGPEVEVVPVVDSTNAALSGTGFRHRHAVLAEYQTAGRGRRGRGWACPPGAGLCLSLAYRFDCGLPRLGPLSLVAGIAVARAVEAASGVRAELKWPNDLLVGGRKLAGLLTELRGAVDGPCDVVVGFGLNVRMPSGAIDPGQPWTDLCREGAESPGRNDLAAAVIDALDRAFAEFERDGFEAFAEAWTERDALAGRDVVAADAAGPVTRGRAAGVSPRGGLWLETDDGRIELTAGEVSIRAA